MRGGPCAARPPRSAPRGRPAAPQLPAEIAGLRCEHQAVSPSPCVAEWSRRVDPLVPIHSLPFTTFHLYKDWLIPIFFFFFCLLLLQ